MSPSTSAGRSGQYVAAWRTKWPSVQVSERAMVMVENALQPKLVGDHISQYLGRSGVNPAPNRIAQSALNPCVGGVSVSTAQLNRVQRIGHRGFGGVHLRDR